MPTGKNLIACEPADSGDGQFTAGGTSIEFEEASVAHVDRAVEAAENAFHSYRRLSADVRAEFLDRIAEAIDTSGHLLEAANAETALSPERLAAERARTDGPIANVRESGSRGLMGERTHRSRASRS